MLLNVFLAFLQASLIQAVIINHQNCTRGLENKATDVTVEISECDDINDCPVIKGKEYIVTITFTPTSDTKGLRRQLSASVNEARFPYGRIKDVCPTTLRVADLSPCIITNGLKTGYRYKHSVIFKIHSFFPKISAKVRIHLKHNKKTVVCVDIPVHVVS